jgi:hypothetical protein
MTFPSDRNEPQEHTAEEKRKALAHARGETTQEHGLKSFRDALPEHLRERLDRMNERGISDEEVCPRCTEYTHPGHECCYCFDGGRVARGDGILEPCPKCSGYSVDLDEMTDDEWNQAARIPIKFAEVSIDSWEVPRFREMGGQGDPRPWVKRYVSVWPPRLPFLSLLGPGGVGKTHLAVAVAHEAQRKHGARVRMYRTDEILERFRASFDKETAFETETQIGEELKRIPLLVLDDLTTANDTDWATKKVLSLVNYRYQESLTTIVTANEADLDSRTHRRLLDEGSCVVCQFKLGD